MISYDAFLDVNGGLCLFIRIAKKENNIKADHPKFIGVYEVLSKYRHDISLTYLVNYIKGKPKTDHHHSRLQRFSKIPNKTIAFQIRALKDAHFFE